MDTICDLRNTLDLSPLTPELLQRAHEELRETEENKKTGIQELRNLIFSDTTIDCQTDDEFLLRFLRPTKFYPESAFQLMRSYLGHMRRHADVYAEMGPSQQLEVLQHGLVSVSPLRDQLGRRVTVIRFGAWHHKICSMDDIYRAVVQCAELGSNEPCTQVAGGVAILDMAGTSLRHVTHLSPAYAKKTIDWLQGSFPLRFKAFHIINQPRIFDLIFAMFKPFMGNKLRDRIHFHGSKYTSLHSHVSPVCLTRDYCGQLANFDQAGLTNVLTENEHLFKEIRTYAYKYQH